jgi:hypothetical protein
MTQFTNFSGDFSRQNITLFADFASDASPFSYNNSAALATATQTNTTVSSLGVAAFGITSGTSAGVFPYAGVYMSAAVSAGSAVDTTYRLGRGAVEVSARVSATTSSVATHVHVVGISSCDRDANVRPGLDFVGFFSLGNATVWSVGVINNGQAVSFATNVDKGSLRNLRVVVSKNANSAEFYIDGTLIRKIDTPIRTTVGMVPCIEIKDCVSGASNAAGSLSADYFLVQQQVAR